MLAQEQSGEFEFHDSDFKFIAQFVNERTGIVLTEQKRALVYGRLSRRLRTLGMDTFAEYCASLQEDGDGAEVKHLINAITTNLTEFFREPHHFDFLESELSPLKNAAGPIRLRIWSAGCSSGEEPYSIAMTVRKVLGSSPKCDVKILATDIDSDILATAKAGNYSSDKLSSIPRELASRFTRQSGSSLVMSDELKSMIVFNELNLFDKWPFKRPFDIIFCRNVAIYFSIESKKRLFDRFADNLKPNGLMIIGHSENLARNSDRFTHVARTVYRKRG